MPNLFARAAESLGMLVREEPPAPDFSAQVLPPSRTAAPGGPMSLDIVFRSVMYLETLAGQLTFDAWRDKLRLDTPALLAKPDVFGHLVGFTKETVGSMASRGEAFWKHYTNTSNQVTGLEVLDPRKVEPLGRGRFSVDGKVQVGGISHLKLMRIPGELHGLGPLQACKATVDGAVELRRWADNWLDQAKIPPGQMTTEQQLDKATADRYAAQFSAKVGYRNGPVVLGSGLKYSPLLLTPEEMQWLESQNFNVVAVARMFGIPPRAALVTIQGDTYANLQQDEIAAVRDTLMAYVNEMEAAFTDVLPRGTWTAANLEALLRTDTKTRYEGYQIGLASGFLEVPEIRDWEHLGPKTTDTPTTEENPA